MDTQRSKKKVILFGSLLFVPVVLWAIQGFLLGHLILDKSIAISVAVGLTLAAMIFIVDRSIISAPSTWGVNFLRLVLGLIFAIIGSIILDEVFFHSEIDTYMAKFKSELLGQQLAVIDDQYGNQLAELKAMVDQNYMVWNTALEDVKAEADGTGGSGIKGVSAITKLKMQLTQQQELAYSNSLARLNDLQSQVDLKKEEIESSFNSGFSDSGLLLRMKVLFDFIWSDWISASFYIIITLGLIIIEFLLIIMKLFYPKTNYELKQETVENMGAHKIEAIEKRQIERFNPAVYSEVGVAARKLINTDRLNYLN